MRIRFWVLRYAKTENIIKAIMGKLLEELGIKQLGKGLPSHATEAQKDAISAIMNFLGKREIMHNEQSLALKDKFALEEVVFALQERSRSDFGRSIRKATWRGKNVAECCKALCVKDVENTITWKNMVMEASSCSGAVRSKKYNPEIKRAPEYKKPRWR